ncbi:MAG: hypothetical protein A2092_02600 [Rhodobacteraceae bacterium GWE1_64_9]|nr:MAG: hypothetical protein A2092_02600 [Rhodobacteraceae bacterium GWE1_64_9]
MAGGAAQGGARGPQGFIGAAIAEFGRAWPSVASRGETSSIRSASRWVVGPSRWMRAVMRSSPSMAITARHCQKP